MKILNPRGCIFGLYFQVKIIGLTGIVIDKENAEVAHLVMSYIKDNFRGLNLSAFLYESRIEWAKRQSGIKTLTLDINEDHLPSQLACQKHGFKIVHSYIDEGQKVLTYHLDL